MLAQYARTRGSERRSAHAPHLARRAFLWSCINCRFARAIFDQMASVRVAPSPFPLPHRGRGLRRVGEAKPSLTRSWVRGRHPIGKCSREDNGAGKRQRCRDSYLRGRQSARAAFRQNPVKSWICWRGTTLHAEPSSSCVISSWRHLRGRAPLLASPGAGPQAARVNGFNALSRADQRWRPSSRRTTAWSRTQFSCIVRRGPINGR